MKLDSATAIITLYRQFWKFLIQFRPLQSRRRGSCSQPDVFLMNLSRVCMFDLFTRYKIQGKGNNMYVG